MWMISWYEMYDGVRTISIGDQKTVKSVALMFEDKKIKYKVTDRLGLSKPELFGMGDMEYWLTEVDDALWTGY